jgi:hypothetical protein
MENNLIKSLDQKNIVLYYKYMELKEYYCNDKRIDNWLDNHVSAYLNKGKDIVHTELEHVIDFLKSEDSPSRITRLGYLDSVKMSKKWQDDLNNKKIKKELVGDVKIIIKEKNYTWVKLKTKESFNREGKLMQHCVSSYYGREDLDIYSLRDVNNEPHCTIEVRRVSNTINQVKGKQNSQVVGKYHKAVINFVNSTGCKVSHYDLKNYGAIRLSDRLCHIDDLGENEIIEETLNGSFFSNLPKKIKVKGGINLDKSMIEIDHNFTDWEIEGDWKLKGVNIKQDKLIIDSSIYFNLGSLSLSELSCENFSAKDSELEITSLKADNVSIKKSKLNCESIIVKKSLELSNLEETFEITKPLNLKTLIIENSSVEISSNVIVDHLLLINSKMSKESLSNIEVRGAVTISNTDNSEIHLPSWKINNYLDIREANVVSFGKDFSVTTLFGNKSIIPILDVHNISFSVDDLPESESMILDIKETYIIP